MGKYRYIPEAPPRKGGAHGDGAPKRWSSGKRHNPRARVAKALVGQGFAANPWLLNAISLCLNRGLPFAVIGSWGLELQLSDNRLRKREKQARKRAYGERRLARRRARQDRRSLRFERRSRSRARIARLRANRADFKAARREIRRSLRKWERQTSHTFEITLGSLIWRETCKRWPNKPICLVRSDRLIATKYWTPYDFLQDRWTPKALAKFLEPGLRFQAYALKHWWTRSKVTAKPSVYFGLAGNSSYSRRKLRLLSGKTDSIFTEHWSEVPYEAALRRFSVGTTEYECSILEHVFEGVPGVNRYGDIYKIFHRTGKYDLESWGKALVTPCEAYYALCDDKLAKKMDILASYAKKVHSPRNWGSREQLCNRSRIGLFCCDLEILDRAGVLGAPDLRFTLIERIAAWIRANPGKPIPSSNDAWERAIETYHISKNAARERKGVRKRAFGLVRSSLNVFATFAGKYTCMAWKRAGEAGQRPLPLLKSGNLQQYLIKMLLKPTELADIVDPDIALTRQEANVWVKFWLETGQKPRDWLLPGWNADRLSAGVVRWLYAIVHSQDLSRINALCLVRTEGTHYYSYSQVVSELRDVDLDVGVKTGVERAFRNALNRRVTERRKEALSKPETDLRDFGSQWLALPFNVVLLRSERALWIEGDEQQHCVGGYAGRVAGGQSTILSIRLENERTTAELSDDMNIASHLGYKNCQPSQEAKDALDSAISRVVNALFTPESQNEPD